MSFNEKISYPIGGKQVQGGLPTDNQQLQFNAVTNQWEFVNPTSLLIMIGDYEASVAEGSHTFNFPAISFDDDSELILVIDLTPTLTFDLLLRINLNAGASYNTDGRRIGGGIETILFTRGATSVIIASAALIAAVDIGVFGEVKIGKSKGGALDRVRSVSTFYDTGNVQEQMAGVLTVSLANVTDITILTSASTWKVGTRMTLYRVARS